MKTKSNRFIVAIVVMATFIYTKTAAQSSPKHELRAVWLTTFVNIDWPSANNLSTANQQAQLTTMLDQLQAAGINAVFFQVRSQCDAMYNSSIEPWSADLTGMQGRAPSPNYDPLEFLIAASRQRGIEVHAWFNPFRAVSNFNNIGSFSTNHVARTKPEWLLAQGNLRILDPGIPQVRDYVISVVMDLLRRYDVDGIHYDDYFYPYPPTSGSAFNDDATFAANARGFTNRQDWRRDNINLFIQRSNDSIRNVKPWVKFGVSPFGI
ncbi:MAG: glycoside hydrolase family 10 protein, partial [Chitinophagaceae bacterium]